MLVAVLVPARPFPSSMHDPVTDVEYDSEEDEEIFFGKRGNLETALASLLEDPDECEVFTGKVLRKEKPLASGMPRHTLACDSSLKNFHAARKIQALCRGHLVRLHWKSKASSCAILQSFIRARLLSTSIAPQVIALCTLQANLRSYIVVREISAACNGARIAKRKSNSSSFFFDESASSGVEEEHAHAPSPFASPNKLITWGGILRSPERLFSPSSTKLLPDKPILKPPSVCRLFHMCANYSN